MKCIPFVINYWPLIVALAAAVAIVIIRVMNYMKMSKEEQEAAIQKHKEQIIESVRSWALKGVIDAERDLGSGTGKMKLRYVYEKAISLFGPDVAKFITMDQFDKLIQAPLKEMRKLLEKDEYKKVLEVNNVLKIDPKTQRILDKLNGVSQEV